MEDLKTYIVSSVKMFYYLISNVIQLVFQLFTVYGGIGFGYQGNKSIKLDINLTQKRLKSDFISH